MCQSKVKDCEKGSAVICAMNDLGYQLGNRAASVSTKKKEERLEI